MTETSNRYHDGRLDTAMRELRKAVRGQEGEKVLAKVEHRVKYLLRVLRDWNETHAEQARAEIRRGQFRRASLTAFLVFDPSIRGSLLEQIPDSAILEGDEAAARIAEAIELGRNILSDEQ